MISAWKELGKLPRQIWFMALAFLINKAGTMALPFLVLYLTRHLGFSPARAGVVVGVFGAGALATAPIGGWLSDRFGEKPVMVISLLLSGMLLLLYPIAKSYEEVLAITLLWAMTSEVFRPAAFSFVASNVLPEQRKTAFALTRLAINLGMSIGPAVGGLLATFSFAALYIVDGITALIAGLVLAWGVKAGERKHLIPHDEFFLKSFWMALQNQKLVFMLLAFLPIMIVFFQSDSSMPLFLVRNLHFSETTYGLLFTVNTVLIITCELQLNLATNHWPHHRSLAVGALFVAMGFGGMAFADTLLEIIGTVVLWTIGEMILFPAMNAYVSEIAPEGRRGSFMALYAAGFSLSHMIGPPLGATILQWYGPRTLWFACLGIGTLSAFLLSRCRVSVRDPGR